MTVEEQVASLRAHNSRGYDVTSFEWLAKLLVRLLDAFHLPRPYIYPTPEGLARAEWSGSDWEAVASFDLRTQSVGALAARHDADEMHVLAVALAEPGAESKLGRFLTEHLSTR